MRRSRITITLHQTILDKVDQLIDEDRIRNRSHAIELILHQHFKKNIKTAVILAGGQGTRLPKSLLLIKGKPLLEYIINNLRLSNIIDIVICTGHLGEKIKEYFGNGERFGVHITYYHEKEPSQTGGALLKIKHLLKNQMFIVVYGDIVTNLNFQDLVNFHDEHKSLATIALTIVIHPANFGQLTLHGIRLVNFYQKTKSKIKSNLINCGIYVFQPEIFNYFPKNKQSFLLEDVIEVLIEKKEVNGFVFEEQWFDVGNPKNYEKAIKEFKVPPSLNQKSSQSI